MLRLLYALLILVLGLATSGRAAVPLAQIDSVTYQTEHCLFIIDASVPWSSPANAYNAIYSLTNNNLSGYFDRLTTLFPGSYFSVCYMANTGYSTVPNYIDRHFKANGINEPGTEGAPQSFATVDICRYNLTGSVFRPVLGVYDHELGHAWGAQVFNWVAPTLSNGHWLSNSTVDGQLSATYSDDGGVTVNKIYGDMTAGFRYHRVDNLRSNDWETFSEQELYLLGAAPQFPTSYVLNNPVYNADGSMSASSVSTFTHAALVALHGARSPDYTQASKRFKLGFVYIARDVAEVNSVYQAVEQSIAHFTTAEATDTAGYRFQTPFLVNTKFRASVDGLLADLDGVTTPTISVTETYTTSSDGAAVIHFTATDGTAVTPVVSVVPASAQCSVGSGTVQISDLPNGVHFFTLKAENAAGKKAFAHFVVEVLHPAGSLVAGTPPVDQTATAGQTMAFTAAVSGGTGSYSYSWYRQAARTSTWNPMTDGAGVGGATTATLSVTATTAMEGDRFLCAMTDGSGVVSSAIATLMVDEQAPPIASQPVAQTLAVGNAAHFSVGVTGVPLTFGYQRYQWERLAAGTGTWMTLANGGSYSGATTASLTVSGTTLAMSGDQFRCAISNTAGAVTTQAVALTVIQPPSVTAQPVNVTTGAGQTATFSVTVAGTAPFSYQWKKYSTPIAGATSSTLTLTDVQAGDAGAYVVTVTNAIGSTLSNVGSLTVTPAAPGFVVQPLGVATSSGRSLTLTASAMGTNPITYQWRKAGVPISGATAASFSINPLQLTDAADYSVLATNSVGSTASLVATVTVADAYDAFSSSYGLDPAGNGLPSANPSSDGVVNLLKFALGENPAVSSQSGLPVLTKNAGGATAVYQFNVDPAALATSTVEVEYSSNLVSWTKAVDGQNGIVITVQPVNATKTVISVSLPASGQALFVHLKVSH
ncbi:MAG: immunoglobulin domain-containing protein [Nibricoccus sp.]